MQSFDKHKPVARVRLRTAELVLWIFPLAPILAVFVLPRSPSVALIALFYNALWPLLIIVWPVALIARFVSVRNGSRAKGFMKGKTGFAVSIVDRGRLRYQEQGRSLMVSAEALSGDRPFAVYWNCMGTEIPGVDEDLNEDERLRIVANIQAWFRRRGYEVDFFPPLDSAMRWSSV